MRINSENNEIKNVLERHRDLLIANGGKFHSDIEVIESNGDFRIISNVAKDDHEELISIPGHCLPTVDDFELSVENDELIIKSCKEAATGLQRQLFEDIITLYNLSGKVKQHKASSLWLGLKNCPQLLDYLIEGRTSAVKIKKFYDLFKSDDVEQLVLKTFIGSRVLNYKGSDPDKARSVIMPFIDFFNHHHLSTSYKTRENKENGFDELFLLNSKSAPDSDECFVSYNRMDALDALFNYGFVDTACSYVSSVPMEIIIPEVCTLKLLVKGRGLFKKKLPDRLKNIRFYIPRIIGKDKNSLEVGCMLVPGENAPRALRRALVFLISQVCPRKEPSEYKEYVLLAEEQIINKNRAFYEGLQHELARDEVKDNIGADLLFSLQQLVDTQLEKLKQYTERCSAM